MNELTKKLLNYFLIGTFSVIPIVVVLQIIFFVKDLISDLFSVVYEFSDNYVYTGLFFIFSFLKIPPFMIIFLIIEYIKILIQRIFLLDN